MRSSRSFVGMSYLLGDVCHLEITEHASGRRRIDQDAEVQGSRGGKWKGSNSCRGFTDKDPYLKNGYTPPQISLWLQCTVGAQFCSVVYIRKEIGNLDLYNGSSRVNSEMVRKMEAVLCTHCKCRGLRFRELHVSTPIHRLGVESTLPRPYRSPAQVPCWRRSPELPQTLSSL